jgi:Histidine kinase-, DNA gyrase B-, and HSP90-like ATPase
VHRFRPSPLVVPENFIQATRDSGYKTFGSALAELVDNAFEANARRVAITVGKAALGLDDLHVTVADDGCGMDPQTIRQALRFGWSSRFNQRTGSGRFGMGLPNASLSHARRVEVWSATDGAKVRGSWLDIDEVLNSGATIPPARPIPLKAFLRLGGKVPGTVVMWQRCDRIAHRKLGPLCRKLRSELGILYRFHLWEGKQLTVNGEAVVACDPLFMKTGSNPTGALQYGPELTYEVALPSTASLRTSIVRVKFSELPVRQWHTWSNADKNEGGIAKNAGVTIVRANREIDRGWFFMGQKRKENYDDWWRCEVRFQPDLDELFGVTHTKQGIHPTDALLEILESDIERTARELNGRARRAFLEVKGDEPTRDSERIAERNDRLLEPPATLCQTPTSARELGRGSRGRVGGLEYRLKFAKLDNTSLYEPVLEGVRVTVLVNENHPLMHSIFGDSPHGYTSLEKARRDLQLMILAAARSEIILTNQGRTQTWIKEFRQSWSQTLATFLG